MNEKQDIENNSNIKKIRTDNKQKESTTTSSKAKTSSKKLFKKIQKILILQRTGRKNIRQQNKKKYLLPKKRGNRVKYQQAHLFQKDIYSMEKLLELVLQILTMVSQVTTKIQMIKIIEFLKILYLFHFQEQSFIINIKQAQI